MTGEGTYQCTLDQNTQKKAKNELNEDPKQRASQIETLREWVKKQPHIRSRTDDVFLLRFLRTAKFSQLRAHELLENFWTVRSVEGKGAPDWFKGLDPLDPKVSEVMDLGTAIPLPGHDDEGRKVVLIRTGHYNPKIHDFADVMKVGFMINDVLLLEEPNQVHGFITLLDFSEFSASHVLNWSRDTISKAMKCWQDTYPMRQKGVNYYNTPMIFNALFEIFNYFSKEKMKKRFHFHKDSLESLYKQIPKRMLPDEYGGDAGSLNELIKATKDHVLKHREEIILNADTKYGIDESKRPQQEQKAGGWGITGSFRKLSVE